MKNLFILTRDNPEIAFFELNSVMKPDPEKVEYSRTYGTLTGKIMQPGHAKDIDRLAYTNFVYELYFTADKEDLLEKMGKFDWQKHYSENFWLRIVNMTSSETGFKPQELADIVWKKLEGPKASKDNPKNTFDIIFADRIYVCRLIWENPKDFNHRKPHMRPMLHPSSLSPKLARACVNMTGIGTEESGEKVSSKDHDGAKRGSNKRTILDPFCGTGGILIEAALMGFTAEGIDIDEIMIARAKANLDFYNIKDAKIIVGDATSLKGKHDYIVTDLPYAKNTRNTDLEELYVAFLKRLGQALGKRAVVIFPDFVDYTRMLAFSGANLAIIKEFEHYIHRTMTKKIVVLEPSMR